MVQGIRKLHEVNSKSFSSFSLIQGMENKEIWTINLQ